METVRMVVNVVASMVDKARAIADSMVAHGLAVSYALGEDDVVGSILAEAGIASAPAGKASKASKASKADSGMPAGCPNNVGAPFVGATVYRSAGGTGNTLLADDPEHKGLRWLSNKHAGVVLGQPGRPIAAWAWKCKVKVPAKGLEGWLLATDRAAILKALASGDFTTT